MCRRFAAHTQFSFRFSSSCNLIADIAFVHVIFLCKLVLVMDGGYVCVGVCLSVLGENVIFFFLFRRKIDENILLTRTERRKIAIKNDRADAKVKIVKRK